MLRFWFWVNTSQLASGWGCDVQLEYNSINSEGERVADRKLMEFIPSYPWRGSALGCIYFTIKRGGDE